MTMRELNDSTHFVYWTNDTFYIQNRCTGLWPSEAVESAFYLFFLASSLIGNVLIVAIFYKDKILRTTVNYFMVNMCVSDLIIPVINLPLWIAYNRSKTIMFLFGFPSFGVSISVSLFSMVALAAERFRAIIFPMRPALFSQKKCYVAIAVMWLSSLAFFMYYIADLIITTPYGTVLEWNLKNDVFLITCFGLICLSIAFITIFYVKVAIFLYRQKNSLHLASEVVKKRAKRNRKIITMLIIIVILFYVVWIPYFVFKFLTFYDFGRIPCTFVWFGDYFLPILYPTVNPVVYIVFNEKYRRGLKEILCLFKDSSDNSHHNIAFRKEDRLHNSRMVKEAVDNVELQDQQSNFKHLHQGIIVKLQNQESIAKFEDQKTSIQLQDQESKVQLQDQESNLQL